MALIIHTSTVEAAPARSSFFDQLNIELKSFEIGNGSTGAALGFSYAYDEPAWVEPLQAPTMENRYRRIELIAGLSANGNIAFNSRNNPRSFLDTRVNLGIWFDRSPKPSTDKQEQQLAEKLSKLDSADPKYNSLNKSLVDLHRQLPPISALSMSARMYLGMESDQTFSRRQRTVGLDFSTAYLSYHQTDDYSHSTLAAQLNILDYPFALIRMLSGENFVPSGAALPSLQLGLAWIEPEHNDPRASVGDTSPYYRGSASLAFKTRLGFSDKNNAPIYFSANTRYYRELGASAMVKNAELDLYTYHVFIIEYGSTYVSYAKGKLPLDSTDDTVYEIGWKSNL
ncbi:MAG: hypothetical protein OEZ68_14040 [Gammaproteobacteria bacterium]|nr:hypothetical protein [Gammaproteobacteria bacterium]